MQNKFATYTSKSLYNGLYFRIVGYPTHMRHLTWGPRKCRGDISCRCHRWACQILHTTGEVPVYTNSYRYRLPRPFFSLCINFTETSVEALKSYRPSSPPIPVETTPWLFLIPSNFFSVRSLPAQRRITLLLIYYTNADYNTAPHTVAFSSERECRVGPGTKLFISFISFMVFFILAFLKTCACAGEIPGTRERRGNSTLVPPGVALERVQHEQYLRDSGPRILLKCFHSRD